MKDTVKVMEKPSLPLPVCTCGGKKQDCINLMHRGPHMDWWHK